MAGNHRVVALNVGTANIVAVQGLVDDSEQGRRTAVVEKITSIQTPKGSVRANGVYLPGAVVEAIKEMWRRDGLQTKNVIMGVDSRRLQSGVKWVPYYHPKDLAEVAQPDWVNFEAITPSPVDAKNSTIHHFVLRERTITDAATDKPTRQILLLVISVPKAETQAMANIAEDAGLEMVGTDLDALGMLRAASLPVREDKRVVDMLVDIGETFTTMLLHNNGNIRAVETVSGSAGESVTRAIADEVKRLGKEAGGRDLDPDEVKRTLAQLVLSYPDGPVTQKALGAARRQSMSLSGDLETFINSYLDGVNQVAASGEAQAAQHHEERGLASITLTGGGSFLHDLGPRLGDKESGGFNIPISQAGVSRAYVNVDGTPVKPHKDGVSVVSTVGLLTADRKAI